MPALSAVQVNTTAFCVAKVGVIVMAFEVISGKRGEGVRAEKANSLCARYVTAWSAILLNSAPAVVNRMFPVVFDRSAGALMTNVCALVAPIGQNMLPLVILPAPDAKKTVRDAPAEVVGAEESVTVTVSCCVTNMVAKLAFAGDRLNVAPKAGSSSVGERQSSRSSSAALCRQLIGAVRLPVAVCPVLSVSLAVHGCTLMMFVLTGVIGGRSAVAASVPLGQRSRSGKGGGSAPAGGLEPASTSMTARGKIGTRAGAGGCDEQAERTRQKGAAQRQSAPCTVGPTSAHQRATHQRICLLVPSPLPRRCARDALCVRVTRLNLYSSQSLWSSVSQLSADTLTSLEHTMAIAPGGMRRQAHAQTLSQRRTMASRR